MNMKIWMSFFLLSFVFQNYLAASQQIRPSLSAAYWVIASDLDSSKYTRLSLENADVKSRMIGRSFVSSGCRNIIALEGFGFSDGSLWRVGVFPNGAKIDKLPSFPGDTLGYVCKSGIKAYVPLSKEPTSLKYPGF